MFKVQVTCATTVTTDNSSVAKVQWNKSCSLYSLTPEDFGKTFKSTDKNFVESIFEIIGCKPSSRKYPILAKNLADGKIFPAIRVKLALKQ